MYTQVLVYQFNIYYFMNSMLQLGRHIIISLQCLVSITQLCNINNDGTNMFKSYSLATQVGTLFRLHWQAKILQVAQLLLLLLVARILPSRGLPPLLLLLHFNNITIQFNPYLVNGFKTQLSVRNRNKYTTGSLDQHNNFRTEATYVIIIHINSYP